jgi:hypothetical protein
LDVEQIIERQAAALPLELILDELQPLLQLKDDPQSFQRVQQLLNVV